MGGSISFARQATALGASYVLGTFNDNFFKQAGLLLAVSAGNVVFQSQATFLFALPFVLFSAWSGWLADRYSKKTLIVYAKAIEVVAMALGAWGIITLQWEWMLGMVFCMGLNSTLFSPALNASIPESFPAALVPRVNALYKLATTVSILLGIALAGIALDQEWWTTSLSFGRCLVGAVAFGVAVLGLCSTVFIVRRPGAKSNNPFPATAVVDSFRYLRETYQDFPLFISIVAESYFYFLATLLLLQINRLGVDELGFSYSMTSMLSVALMGGICVGSLVAARGTPESWRTLFIPSLAGVGFLLGTVYAVPALPEGIRLPALFILYGAAGMCGGLYLIPLTSYIQVRPRSENKGRTLGVSNCLSFSGILLAGQLYLVCAQWSAAFGHLLLGGMAVFVAGIFFCVRKQIGRGEEHV